MILRYGLSPLHIASENGFIDVVDYLIEIGMDINVLDDEDRTPLFYCFGNGKPEMAWHLISKGASIAK